VSIDDSSDIVLDHNSVSWANDGNIDITSNHSFVSNITISWNIISEPLAMHPTNMLITSNNGQDLANRNVDIDLHHNLLMNASSRNPQFSPRRGRFINNLVYNVDSRYAQMVGGVHADYIGNYFKRGPLSAAEIREIKLWPNYDRSWEPGCCASLHVVGNKGPHNPDPDNDNWGPDGMVWELGGQNEPDIGPLDEAEFRRDTPLANSAFPIIANHADDLEELLKPTVGASRRLDCDGSWVDARDAVDTRLINELTTNQGIIPANENEVGGFPTIAAGTPCADADHDGMPDVWELRFGLDPFDPTDGNGDLDRDGYTNLEEFLNG
jgi:hypothetical protein